MFDAKTLVFILPSARVKTLKLKSSVYLRLHKRKHFTQILSKSIFKMQLSDDARNFLEKSLLCFVGIKFKLDCQIKSVNRLKTTCNDLWPWLIEFRKIPSNYAYETHCDNLERWLNILNFTNEDELTDTQINEMKMEVDAAYQALKTILS